jgi:catechol 2,3-dioxygenase-like lactoylglutathione lyase family enzyme
MATETAIAPVKFHVSLNVANLDKSVDFYQLLFGKQPAKCRPDYAKFESEDPQLVLSLEPNPRSPGGSLNHLGLRVGDSAALVEIQQRFEAAGIRTQREEGVECCYALQTKFWVTDPDRNLWELYILHEDLEHRGIGQTLDEMLPDGSLTPEEAPPPPVAWEHTLGMDLPARLPHEENSVDEVNLVGTFNGELAPGVGEALLAEVRRILRPGGRLMIHSLVADRGFPKTKPSLPGPAAYVQAIPIDAEVLRAVEAAGFAGTQLEKFSAEPCFVHDGVQMRELKLFATKPPVATTDELRQVLYKGPLKQVTDDAGNVFPRGQRVIVSAAAVAALKQNPAADDFVFFATVPVVKLGCG